MLPIPSGWAIESVVAHGNVPDNGSGGIESIITSLEQCLAPSSAVWRPRTSVKSVASGSKRKRMTCDTIILDDMDNLPHISSTGVLERQQQKDIGMMSHMGGISMVDAIRASIQSSKTFDSRSKLSELNLDSVLSSTSYKNLMRQTFGSDGSIIPREGDAGAADAVVVRVPTITRAFEESYMREASVHERQCVRGLRCECMFIDVTQPFVSVEFLTLDELANPPEIPQLCVVCSRKETQYLYFDMVFGKRVYNSVIQRFGNASGANEYAPECLLRCTRTCDLSCMPKPIMSHQRNRYVVTRHRDVDVLCLKQSRWVDEYRAREFIYIPLVVD